MANNCSFIPNPKLKTLVNFCAGDMAQFLDYFSTAFTSQPTNNILEADSKFKEWYKKEYNKDLDIDNIGAVSLKNAILKYYQYLKPTYQITEVAINNTRSALFGYTSTLARKKFIKYAAVRIYKKYMNEERTKENKKENLLSKFAKEFIEELREDVASMLSEGLSEDIYDEIYDNLTENCGEYIDELIRAKESNKEGSYSNAILNYLAFYRELTTVFKNEKTGATIQNEIFDEIYNSKPINLLKLSRYDNFDEAVDAQNQSLEKVESEEESDEDDDIDDENKTDTTIRDHSLHHGELDDWQKHIDDRIKRILNTIPKLSAPVPRNDGSTEENSQVPLELKIDSTIGCPEYMDASDIATILYSYCDKDDVDALVESIRAISEAFPEYAGLSILANMLESNSDIKFAFFATFAKHIMPKAQTILEDNVLTYTISNTTANRLETLRSQFRSEFISNVLNVDIADLKKAYDAMTYKTVGGKKTLRSHKGKLMPNILYSIKDEVGRSQKVDDAIEQLYNVLKLFYPTITPVSLTNYVYNNTDLSMHDAMAQLYDVVKKLIYDDENGTVVSNVSKIQRALKEKQDAIRNGIAKNRRLQKEIRQGKQHTADEFVDVNAIRRKDAITPDMLTAPSILADLLLKYVLIKTNLNSVNVHGNQSSDVLNSSLITRLKAIFENPERGPESPLQLLANEYHLDTNTQFRLSNILIEQDGHAGVFRLVDGHYVPTEYANELIQFTLFNGAVNRDTETPVLYSEMSKGDYIGTSWANYFSPYNGEIKGKHFKLGSYFLRIPSDAPKTFILRAPRYVIDAENQLFKTSSNSETEYNIFINDIVTKLIANLNEDRDKRLNIPKEVLSTAPIIHVTNEEDFVKHILSTGEQNINLLSLFEGNKQEQLKKFEAFDKTIKPDIKTGTVNIALNFVVNDVPLLYVLSGTYKKGKTWLNNVKFELIANITNNNGATIIDKNDIVNSLTSVLDEHFKDTFIKEGSISYDGQTIYRKRDVIKSHQIFRQLKNAFKQELLDGVAAARLMFETDVLRDIKGNPILKNGKEVYVIRRDKKLNPILKKEWAADLNGLNPIYHFSKDGAYKNGKLTGRVFESDRFILFDEKGKTKRNYGQELLEEVVLYLNNAKHSNINSLIFWSEENGTFDLELSAEQEAAIDAKIEEYINDFVDNSLKRLKENKDFLKGRKLTTDNVADYVLNYQLAYLASNELLEGDTKYYSDVQTFLKRTKEYQMAGNPYGMASIRRNLTSSPVKEMQIGPASWGVTLTDRFNAVTFHTTKKFRRTVLETLKKALTDGDKLGKRALSNDEADNLLYGYDGKHGYTDAKVNDAQSYITFDEWIRRVAMRGELEKYTPLINKIKNKEELTKEDLTEFVQVQKNVYYDLYYDKVTGRIVPRQIKNAEYVLIPQFVEGTELAEILKFMEANGISQINTDETSKASNNYIIDIFNEDGSLSQNILDANSIQEIESKKRKTKEEKDKLKRGKSYVELVTKAIQPYSYNNLYEQQKVPQHIFANNKFAIQIAKKIIDNIQQDHPLYHLKQEYFKLMTTNIRQSFISLMKEYNIPVDENGNLTSTDPTIYEKIDYKKFYDKLKTELGRLGLDENSLDYAILNEDSHQAGDTIMPNYLGIMINKLESIVQSIVTKNVTRQTLHGFHAAQITAIGHVPLATKDTIDTDKDGSLKYHPAIVNPKTGEIEQFAYVEVKLCYSAFGIDKNSAHYRNMTDEQIIEELKRKGLDEFIGYRIPTEGKQSTAVMKLVGFLPDASGSTIVLPEEWVPQTSSDFDFDSVYGIMHKPYINRRTGEVFPVKYKSTFNTYDWFDYVAREIGGKIEGITDDEFTLAKAGAKTAAKEAVKVYRAKLQALEQEAYKNLPGFYGINKKTKKPIYVGAKGCIVKIHRLLDEAYGRKPSREKYIDQLKNEHQFLTEGLNRDDLTEEEIKAVDTYDGVILTILDSIENPDSESNEIYKQTKNETLNEKIDEIKRLQHEAYSRIAAAEGLMSEEEYLAKANATPEEYNSKTKRDNRIVAIMLELMNHPYSLEENLFRSNFDNIAGNDNAAVDKLRSKVEKTRRAARSPYNILDEAEFQEDAMQGFALKGFSVSRDTFCSVCNTVRPTIALEYSPIISYDFSNLSDEEFNKKFNELSVRFNDENQINVTHTGKVINIRHNKLGWSNGNDELAADKNIDGKYITVYTSQTTAHILDAMKSGPVPNVNKYTFGVYKTLLDIGSRAEVAVGFIMHPAIAVINKYYNRTNSIYASDTSNKYIEHALEEYCDRLASVNKTLVFKRKATLQDKLEVINKKYNVSISTDYINNILKPISQSDIERRLLDEQGLKEEIREEYVILQDMAHVLHFAKLMELTNHINSIQQISNPDKFGAKQSIFETERVFKQLYDYIDNRYVIFRDVAKNKSVFTVDGKDILEAIYPGFYTPDTSFDDCLDNFIQSKDNVQQSKYPSLCAHLKYGSGTSIVVNKAFFVTQTPGFRKFISSVEGYFSDNKRLDEKTYKELRTYVISALFRKTSFLNSSLSYDKNNGFIYSYDNTDENLDEYRRVFGYNRGTEFTVPVKLNDDGTYEEKTVRIEDVNDPSQDEIDLFAALSPAQKIEFLKNRIGGEGIFNYINTRLYTTFKTRNASPGAHLISFKESTADIDYLRDLFYKAFTNRNPLIALAAADVIKYAFIVDGYQFGRNGVSKLIPNRLLINDGNYAGTRIVPDLNYLMSVVMSELDENVLENFIRSHPNLKQINTRRVKKYGQSYELSRSYHNVIFLTSSEEDKKLAIKYGILQENGNNFNHYVKLKFGNETTLYRINIFNDGGIVLTPLNYLERNENSDWSANDDLNEYPGRIGSYDYFKDVIQQYKDNRQVSDSSFNPKEFERLLEKTNDTTLAAVTHVIEGTIPDMPFNVTADSVFGNTLINRATEIQNNPDKSYSFLFSLKLDDYLKDDNSYIMVAIPTKTIKNGKEELGDTNVYRITKVDISTLYKYFIHPNKDKSSLNQKEIDILKYLEDQMYNRSISPNYSHMFQIEHVIQNTRNEDIKHVKFSTIGHKQKPIVEATMATIQGVNYMANVVQEEKAKSLSRNFEQQHIFRKAVVVEKHVEDVIIPAAKVIEDSVNNIIDRFERFWEKPGHPNEYYSITDPEVIKEIKKNPALREKYLRAIMLPAAVEEQFAIFRDLDINAEDKQLQPYLDKIKTNVDRLRKIEKVRQAQENYVYQVLDKLSNNPDIKNGFLSVIDGFYKQSTLNAMFNDIQESPNALVQVTMKMVQDALRSSDLQTERDIEAFSSHVEDIKKRAAAAGKTINYDNIIDEYGRFKRHYKDQLIKDRQRLQTARDEKKRHYQDVRDSKHNNELSVESIMAYLDYRRAQLEYDEWKAKYINQEAINYHNNKKGIEDDGYYNTRNALIRQMLDGAGTKYIFAVYEILREKQSKLMRKQLPDIDNDELDDQIDKVKAQLYNLTSTVISDPILHTSSEKKVYSDVAESNDEMIRRVWNDKAASLLLKNYKDSMSSNEHKYFVYDVNPEFMSRVKDNLSIIRKYEKPDENGIPRVDADFLDEQEEYKKAKRWLRKNAREVFIEDESDWLNTYTDALHTLYETSAQIGQEYHIAIHKREFIDEEGDIIGTEIEKDADLLKKIRESQQITYNVLRDDDYTDRTLITLADKDDLVYNEKYWDALVGSTRKQENKEYKETVTAINNILSPYYDSIHRTIDWARMFDDYKDKRDELKELLTALDIFYTKLDNISKGTGTGKTAFEFIKDKCKLDFAESKYIADSVFISGEPQDSIAALFKNIIQGHSKDGTDGNSYLYKTFKIKDEFYDEYVDKKKTNARRVVNKYSHKVITKYYWQSRQNALNKGKKAFKTWFFDNHIWNPYERKFEPIAIWQVRLVKNDDSTLTRTWEAQYGQTKRTVRHGYETLSDLTAGNDFGKRKYVDAEEYEASQEYDEDLDMKNQDYKEGFGHGENYIYGSNSNYDNPKTSNEFEDEMADYFQLVMEKLIQDESSRHYIRRGWLPARVQGEKLTSEFLLREFRNIMGFNAYESGKNEESDIIDFAHDKYSPTPMLALIRTRYNKVNKLKKPIREEFDSEEEYLRKKEEWDKEEAKIKEENLELHKQHHDRNFEAVMKEFISRANKHNTIQHQKLNFYIAQKLLSEQGIYIQRYGKEGDFKKDGRNSSDEQAEYLRKVDKDMYDQFTVTMQRFINNEWKSPEGSLTRYMSILQAMTSAKFMILNHKGGVANVTYGEASIHSESMARVYFNEMQSMQGLRIYSTSVIDNLAHMYSETSSTLAGAVIKKMRVVDYDEQAGLNYLQDELSKVSKRVNDVAYSAQSMGEHAMQNRVMFSMMLSHRLFVNPRHQEFGQPKYIFMNESEFEAGIEEEALLEMLDDKEKTEYKNWKKKVMADANKYKEYVWLQSDFVTNYANAKLGWHRMSEFNKLKKAKLKNAKKIFNDDETHPTIWSQLKLGDNGKLAFKEGSLLAEMEHMSDGKPIATSENDSIVEGLGRVNDADKFLGMFRGRVISVNKKIHGVYDKTGRAKVEQKWWGSVTMQYHKHIPMGLAKRYRSKGYFNEERGSKEKGAYASIMSFLAIPLKKHQTILDLTDKEVETGEAIQNLAKEYLNFFFHVRTAYGSMPEFEKANVRRICADFQAIFASFAACVALKAVASDDDKDKWWYNFWFYQTDRLNTESSQYLPWVLPQETRKLFKTPVAGLNEIDDGLNALSFITQAILQGDNFEEAYTSGVNAGRHKLKVYIERNIPFWRGIRSAYIDIKDNNKAYKAGKNLIGFINIDDLLGEE